MCECVCVSVCVCGGESMDWDGKYFNKPSLQLSPELSGLGASSFFLFFLSGHGEGELGIRNQR